MPVLHQILALRDAHNAVAHRDLTAVYHNVQHKEMLLGNSQTYAPLEGEIPEPDKHTPVRVNALETLEGMGPTLARLVNLNAIRDLANCKAKADVIVDGAVLIKDAPTTFLLWLSHEVDNIVAQILKTPVRSSTEDWKPVKRGLYQTDIIEAPRTQNRPQYDKVDPGNDKHAPQYNIIQMPKIIGTTRSRRFSGALTPEQHRLLLVQARKWQEAVTDARLRANGYKITADEEGINWGETLVHDIFGVLA